MLVSILEILELGFELLFHPETKVPKNLLAWREAYAETDVARNT